MSQPLPYCLKCGNYTESKDFCCSKCARKEKEKLARPGWKLPARLQVFNWKRIALIFFGALFAVTAAVLGLPLLAGQGENGRVIGVPGDYPSIQEAIDAAGHGDTVVVEAGTYYENIDFRGKRITVRSTRPGDWKVVAETVIHGSGRGSTVTFQEGEYAGTVLEGFTITGGSGTPAVYNSPEGGSEEKGYAGGGILVVGRGIPTIRGNLIKGNGMQSDGAQGQVVGGGIFVRSASPVIENNIIEKNGGSRGGGIALFHSEALLAENLVTGNEALWEGGGIFVFGEGGPRVVKNTVTVNRAESGGGLYAFEASAEISGNIFAENVASFNGGGISAVEVTLLLQENEVRGNLADESGGGLYFSAGGGTISGNRFVENSAGWRGGGGITLLGDSHPELTANIFEKNRAPEGSQMWIAADAAPRLSDPDCNIYKGEDPAPVYRQQ